MTVNKTTDAGRPHGYINKANVPRPNFIHRPYPYIAHTILCNGHYVYSNLNVVLIQTVILGQSYLLLTESAIN